MIRANYCRGLTVSFFSTRVGLSAGMPMLDSDFDPQGEVMTASDARHPRIMDRPACTPSAIRTVLAANADAEVLQQYESELDVAYEQARERGDLTPLVETVRRWWFEADAWRDPDAQRKFLARVEHHRQQGPPPPAERVTRQEIHTRYGV